MYKNFFKINKLINILNDSKDLVFFGGAGISTESGVPDYISKKDFNYRNILSVDNFKYNPEEFYNYFFENNLLNQNSENTINPNKGHYALTKLEEMGFLKAIITQNIDGLHQKAGSKNVIELHGNISEFNCINCNLFYNLEDLTFTEKTPKCKTCFNILKPNVVLYGEDLDNFKFEMAKNYIENADTLIIGGTSLTVNPAASLIKNFKGTYLVIINKSKSLYDYYADLVIYDSLGKVLSKIT